MHVDWQLLNMFLKVVIFLPFVILLIYIFMKYGGEKLQNIQNGRYMKIIDRVPLSKENALLIVKIGENGYVMSSTNGKVEILFKIDDKELLKIQELNTIPQYDNLKDFYKKLRTKKEDKNE